MKRTMKSLLSLALAVVMAASTCVMAFAKSGTVTPIICLHGFTGSDIYNYVNTDKEELILSFHTDHLAYYGVLAYALGQMLWNSTPTPLNVEKFVYADPEAIVDNLATFARKTEFNCDKNGNPKRGSGIKSFDGPLADHPEFFEQIETDNKIRGQVIYAREFCERIGKENVYEFYYDWRLDGNVLGESLDRYIDMVKKQTGAKKVILNGDSEGGMVMAAYLDRHLNDNELAGMCFVDSAFAGLSVTHMFAKDFTMTEPQVERFLRGFAATLADGDYETLVRLAAFLLQYRLHTISDNVHRINDSPEGEALVDRIFLEVLKPLFGNCPAFLEFIPYKDFDRTVKVLTDMGYLDKTTGLYRKICTYHKTMGRLNSNLQQAVKKGIRTSIIANYGEPAPPFTKEASEAHSDVLIDTTYASAGATVAEFGKKLNVKSGRYVSPDKVIDASTCALPESTWFIAGVMHTLFREETELLEFVLNLTLYPTQPTLDKIKKQYGYSQYLYADPQAQTLVNVTKDQVYNPEHTDTLQKTMDLLDRVSLYQ